MERTNNERVGRALELVQAGLGPFVDCELEGATKTARVDAALERFRNDPQLSKRPLKQWDVAALLKLMCDTWNDLFRPFLGHMVRAYVSELREHRKRWAHQERFSAEDTYRALDTTHRLLMAVAATQAADYVGKLKTEILVVLAQQERGERDKQDSLLMDGAAMSLNDAFDFMCGKETHAPGEVEDSVPRTVCGLETYADGSAVDRGRVAAPNRLWDVDCIVCCEIMEGKRVDAPHSGHR